MGTADTPASRGWLGSFSQRLDELGWQEHSNLFTQVRFWNDRPQQMKAWAAELMAGSPDVAITVTNPALEVMKPIAGSVPIVFIGSVTRWAADLFPVSLIQVTTSQVSPVTILRWVASGWQYSRRSHQTSGESL
jgi:hypothetical protein